MQSSDFTAEKAPAQEKQAQQKNDEGQKPELAIRRLYIKDVSFETPLSPQIFNEPLQQPPQVDMQLNTTTQKLSEEHTFEVQLTVTITAKLHDKTLFLVEAQQAGIFFIKGLADAQLHHALHSYCPSVLYPYLR